MKENQMEVAESNKLIAKFMNLSWIQHPDGIKIFPKEKGVNFPADGELAKYHCSWDCLMPVVEKIVRQLPKGKEENNYIQSSVKIEASMSSNYPYNLLTHCKIGNFFINKKSTFYILKGGGADSKDGSLIDSVWSAVVEYIEYHNKQTVIIPPKQAHGTDYCDFCKKQTEQTLKDNSYYCDECHSRTD